MNPCIFGWWCYSGYELSSINRTLGYIAQAKADGGMCCIKNVPRADYGCGADQKGPYTYPGLGPDTAPWFDAQVPASQEFYGFIIDEVTGLDSPAFVRSTNNGKLGPVRTEGRKISFSGTIYAATHRGSEYGKQVLAQALNADPCGGCGKGDLVYRKTCPGDDFDGCGTEIMLDNGLRAIYNTGLLTAPEYTDVIQNRNSGLGKGGCKDCRSMAQRVQFTLHAELPRVNMTPQAAIIVQAWTDLAPNMRKWADPNPEDCEECEDCAPPTNDSSSSWGTECSICSLLNCSCSVLGQTYASGSPGWSEPLEWVGKAVSIPPRPFWYGTTTRITLKAGSQPLRNFRILFYENPAGMDPDTFLDTVRSPCTGIEIPYVCANGELVLDGPREKVTLYTPGVERSGDPYAYGLEGGPLSYPSFGCGPIVMSTIADPSNTAVDATLTIEQVPFEL